MMKTTTMTRTAKAHEAEQDILKGKEFHFNAMDQATVAVYDWEGHG